MIRVSLQEALVRLVEMPVLWTAGLYLGALFAATVLLQVSGSAIVAARIGFLGLVALPFFLGGTYGVIRGEGSGLRGYISAGSRYYFRILLSWAVTVSAAILTILLVIAPIFLLGGSPGAALASAALGVGVSFVFFAAFIDTAAAYEDRKTLDSIRRSVEFVTGNLKAVILFYLANLAIGFVVFFLSVVLWSFAVSDRLLPVIEGNQTAIQNMTAPEFVNLVGVPGLWAGVAIGFLAVTVLGAVLVAFKACFYGRAASMSPSLAREMPRGEFDEKGRWYKY